MPGSPPPPNIQHILECSIIKLKPYFWHSHTIHTLKLLCFWNLPPQSCKITGSFYPNGPVRHCSNECFRQSTINNIPNTNAFAQYTCLFPIQKTMQLWNPLSASHHDSLPLLANDCVLFVFVKLAFVSFLSRTVWVYGRFQRDLFSFLERWISSVRSSAF